MMEQEIVSATYITKDYDLTYTELLRKIAKNQEIKRSYHIK